MQPPFDFKGTLPEAAWPPRLFYNDDGTVDYALAVNGGRTYRQQFTYPGGKISVGEWEEVAQAPNRPGRPTPDFLNLPRHAIEHAALGAPISLRPTSLSGGDDQNFVDLMTNLNSAGGGGIKLIDDAYSFDAAVTLQSGVAIKGVGARIANGYAFDGGTIIQGNGLTSAFVYNNVDGSSQPTANDIAATRRYSIKLQDIGFDNFATPIHIGSRYQTGVFDSSFRDLHFRNWTGWAAYFENCSLSNYFNLTARNAAAGATGGFMVRASHTAYNHGNSWYGKLFAESSQNLTRGIVFQARDLAKLNHTNAFMLQCNTGSSGKVSQAATMTNGSPNIGVTDGTRFPLDMPVTVSATANGFSQRRTYYVVSQIGNTIQIADYQGGTALNATGSTAVNIDCYGFPALEVVGYGAANTSAIQSSQFEGLDLEGYGTTLAALQNANLSVNFGTMTSGQDTYMASSMATRNCTGSWRSQATNMSVDIDSTFRAFFCLGANLGFGTDPAPIIQGQPVGYYRHASEAVPVWALSGNMMGNYYTIKAQGISGGSFLYPGIPFGQKSSSSSSASLTLSAALAGNIVYIGTAAATWTFPAWTDGAGGASNAHAGLPFFICNGSETDGANLTLNAGSGDNVNSQTAKISVVIPPGGAAMFYANYDGTATFAQLCGAWHMPDTQDIAYAAAITPNCALGLQMNVGLLTGNLTVNNPTHGSKGMILTLNYAADATAGRAITYGSAFRTSAVPTSTANGKASHMFVRDDTHWVQTGGALVWI